MECDWKARKQVDPIKHTARIILFSCRLLSNERFPLFATCHLDMFIDSFKLILTTRIFTCPKAMVRIQSFICLWCRWHHWISSHKYKIHWTFDDGCFFSLSFSISSMSWFECSLFIDDQISTDSDQIHNCAVCLLLYQQRWCCAIAEKCCRFDLIWFIFWSACCIS